MIRMNYLLIFLYYSFFLTNFHITLPFPYILPLFGLFFLLNIKLFFNFIFPKNLYIFIILCLYNLISILYSINKFEAFKTDISLCLMVFFLVLLYKQLNFKYIFIFIKHTAILGIGYIVLNFILFKHLLNYKGEFIGILGNRHNISLLLSFYFLVIFVFYNFIRSKFIKFLLFFILIGDLYLIIMSYGRVGLYIIILYFSFYFYYFFQKLHIFFKILIVIFIVIGIFYISSLLLDNQFFQYIINRGFTGRNIITINLLKFFYNYSYHFFIGFGSGSLETIWTNISQKIGFVAAVRDSNNIVCVLIEYGVVGLLIFILIFIRYFLGIYLFFKYKLTKLYLISLLPIGYILDISEANWINYNNFLTIIMYIFILFTYKESYFYKKEFLNET